MKDDRLISLNAAIDALNKKWRTCIIGESLIRDAGDTLKTLPPAQPEIIRCKDCRYNNDCEIQYSAQSADEFFCGCAERKDNE